MVKHSSRNHSGTRAGPKEVPSRISPNFKRLTVADRHEAGSVPPHRHEEYEVILVGQGNYDCSVNDTWMTLRTDEGVVVKPGDWHQDRFDDPVRYLGLVFELSSDPMWPAPPVLFAEEVQPVQQRFRVDRDKIWPLIRSMQKEDEARDPVSGHVQDALLLAFFWQMVRALPDVAVNTAFLTLSGNQTFPSQLMRLFRLHVAENLTIGEMADKLHMSESSLAHKCKELIGVSPHKAFLKCRMERAQYLLLNSELSVKEIAAELGFEDQYAFSRTFKTVCSVSPAHWREQQSC